MSTIITRNSANSGSTPSVLVQGELAINVTDGRLFYGSGSGNVVKEFGVTSSYALQALSASYAVSSSYEINYETSSSYADFAVSSSHAVNADNATSASYAAQADNAAAIDIYSFSSPVDSYLLMSNVIATTGVAVGGDTDLRYNSSTNRLTVVNISATSLTGSLLGTASYATQALSSSFASTASFVQNAQTASYVLQAVSASFATTASYTLNALSASHALTASFITASNVYGPYGSNSVISASYALTASSALNAQDILIRVLNQSGNPITKGLVVHITSSGNSSDIPRIITASYENDNNSANTLGIANETIANGAEGFIMTEGVLKGIDTSAFTSGQLIYLGATGSIIGHAPAAPLHAVRLGQVVRVQSNNGSVYVRIDNGYELDELHNVLINTSSVSYGDLLIYSSSLWINSKQLSGSYNLTGSLTISGSSTFTNIGPAIFSGSVTSTGGFTGSLLGTATTASYVQTAQTASYVLQAISASFATTASYYGGSVTSASYALTATSASHALNANNAITASYVLNAVSSSFALTASSVNTLNQNVLITGSLTVGAATAGVSENTLTLGPRDNGSEGGQLMLQAPGGTYTSASMWDNYANQTRLLRGSNAGSDAMVASFNMHTKQMQLPAYNSVSAFPGSPAAFLAVDSSGNLITTSSAGGGGGGVTINNNVDNYVITATGTLNTLNGESNMQFNGSSLLITGEITSSGAIRSTANGAMYFRGGDDAEFWDINVANTVGIYGQQDQTVGGLKLGSAGATLYSSGSRFGIGTTAPVATLDVNGNLFVASGITGSLQGTASYATQALSSSFATTASYYGGSVTSASYALTASYSNTSTSASYALNATNAITATTASYVLQAVSASFASTASSVNQLNQIVNVGAGIQLNNTTADISATSFTAGGGAVQVDGILGEVTAATFIGNLTGTASYATQALSASWAPASNPFPYNGDAQISGSLGVTGSFSTQTFDGTNYVPAISISNFSRTIYDVLGTSSFDADARDLYDSTTVNSISWESRRLSDGLGGASVYWDPRWLVDPLGIIVMRWGIRTGYDSSTSQSIDWGGRILYDANESYSIDWAAKALWGTGGFPTLEWASRYLNDASGNVSVDWGNRLTKDSSNKESINYQNRQLKNSSGNEVLNWSSGVSITGSAIVSGSFESTGSFSVQTYNPFIASTATAIELNDTTRKIYDTSGLLSIDALSRTANYQNLIPSIDWQNSFLYDPLGNAAVQWTGRSLLDSSNTIVVNWDAFALNYKIETNTYLKRFIEVGTQELFSDVPTVAFNYEGEVIEATLDASVNQFDLVYLETDSKWYPVTQGTTDCTKLLGICAETGARPKVILEGSITVNDGTYIDTPIVQGINFGLPIYVRESAGNTMSTVVPTTAGQYVRILGHAYYQNTGSPEYWTMKFRPSNEWIEL